MRKPGGLRAIQWGTTWCSAQQKKHSNKEMETCWASHCSHIAIVCSGCQPRAVICEMNQIMNKGASMMMRERGPPAAHHLLYSLQILLIVHPILWMDQDVAWLDWAHGMLWGLLHSRNNTQPDLWARSAFCNFIMVLTWKRVRFGFFLYSSLSLQKLPHLPGCRQVYSISPTSICINLTSTSDFCSS